MEIQREWWLPRSQVNNTFLIGSSSIDHIAQRTPLPILQARSRSAARWQTNIVSGADQAGSLVYFLGAESSAGGPGLTMLTLQSMPLSSRSRPPAGVTIITWHVMSSIIKSRPLLLTMWQTNTEIDRTGCRSKNCAIASLSWARILTN
jgi:hypothetical protein